MASENSANAFSYEESSDQTTIRTGELSGKVVELQINNFKRKVETYEVDQSVSTPKMAIFGIQDCYLQFFPKGSFWCTKEGHCSLFFGAPSNVRFEGFKMYVGPVTLSDPKELFANEETNETVHGFHDIGELQKLMDENSDTMIVGVEIQKIEFLDAAEKESENILRLTIE